MYYLLVLLSHFCLFFFFFNDTATTEIYTLSLHDALPILRRLLDLDRRIGPAAPLGPRAVVDRHFRPSHHVQPEREYSGAHPGATCRHDGPASLDARLAEHLAERGGGQERAVLGAKEPVVRQAHAARDVSTAHPGARLRLGADETAVAARVHHLLASRVDVGADAAEIANQLGAQAGCEAAGLRRGGSGLDRSAFRLPLRKAAVEDGDLIVTEDAEAPPHPRGRDQILLAIDDHAVTGRDAERTDRGGEAVGVGQHVRQRIARVLDGVDVEVHRAGDVRGDVL